MKTIKDLKIGDPLIKIWTEGFQVLKVQSCKPIDLSINEDNCYALKTTNYFSDFLTEDCYYDEIDEGVFLYFDLDEALKILCSKQQDINDAIDTVHRLKRIENENS